MNIRNTVRASIAVLLWLALVSVASAQTTSSTARGTITGADGTPLANASVVITHEPSGSVKTATTGANGYYFQTGLRVGGPYSFAITASGYRGTSVDEIFLSQGPQPLLDVALESASDLIEEIVVTAQAIPIRDLNNGVGSAYSAEDIVNSTGGTRDVIRTVLQDPLAQSSGEGHLSVAGVNPRFNGLAIDGSLQQDDFGLGSNTYATERSPINLDAVESVSLVASDYDVTASGFTGGLVNLTTKSGTNEWNGSAFYYWQNDSMFGDKYDGGTFNPGEVDETEQGITLGGPIIKDKLFFFASYDEFEAASSVDFVNADANNGIQPGFFEALRSEIQSSLGYDPGGRPQTASIPKTSERALLKLDWNINDLHRAAFTYQSTEETGSSVSSTGFESSWYDIPLELEVLTLQLFSDWNDKLSTTLRINAKDFSRGQNCRAGPGVGHIEVENLDIASVAGTALDGLLTEDDLPDIVGGCDRFRHANKFNDERLQVLAKADYFAEDHVISFGLEYEDFSLFNLFISGGANGRFQYDSFADLLTGTADVNYQNDTSNDANNAAASWGYEKLTLFVQDTFQVSPDFELGVGIRYEKFDQSDTPTFSQTIMDLHGVNSSNNLDGLDLILPRISFRWDALDRTTLSGGFGLFSGGDPKVWTSNAFQLPTVFTSGNFANTDPTVIPQQLLDNVANGTPLPIDLISADFEIPSDWKASLRLEHGFDIGSSEDYTFTAQYLYTKTKDGFLWTNLAQTELNTGVAPDGRVIYADLQALGVDNLVELGNYSDGESHIIALGLAKKFDNGLSVNFSYAFQDVEGVTEGTSSRGISNWRGIIGDDRNNPGAKISPYQIEHSLKLNLGYEKDFFGTGQSMTRIDVFARRLSGDAFSHTFNTSSSNSLFGRAGQSESPFDDDVVYIPTGPSDPAVVYATGFDQAAFQAYAAANVSGTGIIKPNTSTADWSTIVDLRIQQEIPGLPFLNNALGDNNLRLVLNVDNFLNLLNDDWGRWSDGPRFLANSIVTADLVSAADVAANGVDGATALTGDTPRTTCLSQSDCVYRFNSFRDRQFDFTNRSQSVYEIRLGIRFDF